MGRWTIFLINKLFHMSEFSPFMTELAGGGIFVGGRGPVLCPGQAYFW